MLYQVLSKFSKNPETVHNMALSFLKVAGSGQLRAITSAITDFESPALEQKVFGLNFKNPVGAAAGFDKPGLSLKGLETIGFGFAEVGTVSRFPQDGNPKPRLFRLPQDKALINRMGFNSLGAGALVRQLSSYKNLNIPVGVSIGKNKNVPLEKAAEDYLGSFTALYNNAGYFAINVSSPNTPGLRELQEKSHLIEIISALNSHRDKQAKRVPVLVKIAPDLTYEAIDEVIGVCKNYKVDGIIATNTTIGRDGLTSQTNEAGGLSGKPLKQKSTEIIRHIYKQTPDLPIIGVGGIFSAEDAYEKIKAGASLVQVYTGIIYEGPFLVKRINKGLIKLLERDGFKNISEAIGKE